MTAAPAAAKQKEQPKFSYEFRLTLALAVIAWVFSAGILWNKVDDLEKKVDMIERVLLKPNPTISAR